MRPWSRRGCLSSKPKRSVRLLKTPCCCSRSSGVWTANYVASNCVAMRELAAQFLVLAEKQMATVPVIVGHQIIGISLMSMGDIAEARAHYDQAIALYDPTEHRQLATRIGQDGGVVSCLGGRPLFGCLATRSRARGCTLKEARESGQAAALMYGLALTSITHMYCGNHVTVETQLDELVALADEKGALFWKTFGTSLQGCHFALTGKVQKQSK